MSASRRTWVCLLRAINLGSRNKVPMPALREKLAAEGFSDVRSYLQSGNVVLDAATDSAESVARDVGRVVADAFGVHQPVMVRAAEEWAGVVAANPFGSAADERPKILHVLFLPQPPDAAHARALQEHELARGLCRVDGDVVYVDYRDGVHGSKMTPAFFQRTLAMAGTARNWRTVLALRDLIER